MSSSQESRNWNHSQPWSRLRGDGEQGMAFFFVMLLLVVALGLGASLAFFSFIEGEAQNAQIRYQIMRESAQAGIAEAIQRLSNGMVVGNCASGSPPSGCSEVIQDSGMLWDGDNLYYDVPDPTQTWVIHWDGSQPRDFAPLAHADTTTARYEVTVSYLRPSGGTSTRWDQHFDFTDDDGDGIIDNEAPSGAVAEDSGGVSIADSQNWVMLTEFGRQVLQPLFTDTDNAVHSDTDHTATETGDDPGLAFPAYMIKSVGYLDPEVNDATNGLQDTVTLYAVVSNVFIQTSQYAICTCKDLLVQTLGQVNSYDATPALTNGGNIGSNGDISLDGNVTVTGDARAYGSTSGSSLCGASTGLCGSSNVGGDGESTLDISISTGGEFLPNSQGMAKPCPCEQYEVTQPPADIAVTNDNANICLLPAGASYPLNYPGLCTRPGNSFDLPVNRTLVFPPGDYHIQRMRASANSDIVFLGSSSNPVNIYVMACNPPASEVSPFPTNAANRPWEWQITSNVDVLYADPGSTSTWTPGSGTLPPAWMSRSLNLQVSPDYAGQLGSPCPDDLPEAQWRSNNDVYVDFYGPHSRLDINSNMTLYGRVLANEAALAANENFFYDDQMNNALAYKPSPTFAVIAQWEQDQ